MTEPPSFSIKETPRATLEQSVVAARTMLVQRFHQLKEAVPWVHVLGLLSPLV